LRKYSFRISENHPDVAALAARVEFADRDINQGGEEGKCDEGKQNPLSRVNSQLHTGSTLA